MGRVRALLAALVTVCGLLLGAVEVLAAETGKLEITSGGTVIRDGQEIEVIFSLEGFSEIKSGVNALKGTLKYDSAVFELVSQEDFEPVNSWKKLFYNPENGQFVLINSAGSTEDEEVFRMRLRAGQSVPAGEVSVSVEDLSVSEGKEDLIPAGSSLTLSAVVENPGTDENLPEEEEQDSASSDNGGSDVGASDNGAADSGASNSGASDNRASDSTEGSGTEAEKSIVRAGDGPDAIYPAAGVLLGSVFLIGAVAFWKKKKTLSRRAGILTGAAACLGAALLAAGSASAFAGKGELNGDGNIDYTDVELLERHLIGLELLAENRQKDADMNSDGSLTVTDLSLLIRKIERTLDYKVKLSSAMERLYYEKGEDAELRFLADISYGAEIQKVTVNGKETVVEKGENGSLYAVRAETGDRVGVHEFHFTEVLLDGGQKVKTEHTERIGILKEQPEVEDFLIEELPDPLQTKVSFTLRDEDSAVVSAAMEVVNDSDGSMLMSEAVKTGQNEFVLELEEDTEYSVNITVSYDRASGDLPSEESYRGSLAVTKKMELNLDYQFAFGGLRAVNEEGKATERFGRNQPVVLMFESSNAVGSEPERAVINGKSYPITTTGQSCSVTLDGFENTGKKTITAEQLILDNGKAFELTSGNEITLQILKEVPRVEDLRIEEDAENGKFRVAFRLTDPDGALSDHKVLIRNGEGKFVGEKRFSAASLTDGKYDARISLTDTGLTDSYTVQITADQDLTDDGTEPEFGKILAEETVKAAVRFLITDSRAGSAYAEKGGTADLFYEIRHNVDGGLAALVVDYLELKPEQQPDGMWKVSVPAPDQAGVHSFALSQAVFDDGTQADAEDRIRMEILKDVPSVENFVWDKTALDELKIRFDLKDEDSALQDAWVKIEEEGGNVLLEETISVGENEVSAALTLKEDYVITVTADYDRDTNAMDDQSNGYSGEVLLAQTVSVSRDALELKDITAQRLFYTGGNGREEVSILDITGGLPTDPENYYALIEMENMPDFYAGVREFRREGGSGRVYAVLDQEELIRYDTDGTRAANHAFPVPYKDQTGEYPLIKSVEELIDAMRTDPRGSFVLTEDLDASGISPDTPAVPGSFSGELDGNGFRIKNLPTALFQTLSGARIHDLVIEDASVTSFQSGILANVIQNQSLIENVFLLDSSISNGVDGLGAFAGRLVNSTIRRSASVNISVRGLVAVGGIVGKTESGALIEDCYVTGKIQGTYDHPSLGARTGGVAGWHGSGRIRTCYTKAQIIAPAKKGNGGIIGGPNTGSPVIEHSLSMSSGAGYRIAGFDVLDNVKEVYEYSGSGSETSITEENQTEIKETDAVYDRSFYEDTLKFDGNVWNLDGLEYGKLPSIEGAPVEDNNLGIPGYSLVVNHTGYDPARERAYANMAKLMPLSDTRLWVEYGNSLPDNNEFVNGTVRFILPLDADGGLVSGVRRDAPEEIRKIRVVFEDGNMEEYPVTYRKLTGNLAASYEVDGTALRYQFRKYVSDIDDTFLSKAAAMAAGYDYVTEIAALTPEEESRLYTDYYNETVKTDMEDFLVKLYSSSDRYPTYSSHPSVKALAEERMEDEELLKRMLYAYNYYDKWYKIDYRGVSLSRLMFFDGELIDRSMTAAVLAERLLTAPQGQRDTNQSITFYNNVLKNFTGEDLTDFLGGLSKSLAGYSDPNEWFTESFEGVLVEEPAYGDTDGKIRYRIWDNLSGLEEGRKSLVLQILTAPQGDMYLISVPSQLLIGSMNRYQEYLTKDGQERERILSIAEAYADKMGIFYGVSSRWMSSSADQLNSFVNVQYDSRLGFPESEAAAAGTQEKGTTRDPVMKWVYEANNMLNALNGSAAVADGSIVIWMHTPALGTSDYIFFTFSHETAHNQDGRYFYGGAGRRKGTGGEAHADGNIAQEMRDGCMVFNISKINDIGTEMTNNFSYESIDSAEKVHSFYREMFDTGYALDYLAAQAFFDLTPEVQAAVAVQAEHTAGGTSSMSTTYRKLTAQEIGAMNLDSMEKLWDNRISIRNAGSYPEKVGTATDGSYGFESFYTMNWYQSHNDSGSPDTHSFKRLGQEMLGIAGYERGYMTYMSALSENDLDALRKATGDEKITWRQYKMDRYREVEQKLDQIPYFDKDTVIAQFKAAFEADAVNGNTNQSFETKRILYGMVKRVTGDFSEGGIYQSPAVTPVTSAEELIRLAAQNPYGYYQLEDDIDFSGIPAAGGSYITGRFIGMLDGNGHQITGMQYPLFGDLQYAQVKDLTISEPSYAGDAQALFAVKTKKVTLGNVKVEDADMPLPLVRNKNEGYYEYGDMSVTVGARKIAAPEEFLAIGGSPESLKKQYVLEADLDFSTLPSGSFAVSGTFSGELDGNGHSISGLDAVLFEKMDGASVRNLTIAGSNLTGNTQKGALANEIRNSTVEKIRVKDLVIENDANQAGGLAGIILGSEVRKISVEDISIRADNTIGGIAGQFDGRILEDCIVTGKLEGTSRHQMGARIGGITGWQGGGIMRRCFTKTVITAPEPVGNGGIIGGPQNGSAAVESSVSLSTGINANRISGWDVLGITSSAYELESSDSISSMNERNADRIFQIAEEQSRDRAFYIESLGWSEEVWEFDLLPAGGLPGIR